MNVVNVEEKSDRHVLQMEYAQDVDPREDLFNYAVSSGWVILKMTPTTTDLEDIFRKLTTEGQANEKYTGGISREIRSFFNSPKGLYFSGKICHLQWVFFYEHIFSLNQSDLRSLFSVVPMVYLIFVPAISMGLIARERNIGTMETIATLPLKTYEFVLGKYLAVTA
ncbi:MAG: hypothetical protein CM1200mP10_06820 [Candidatus Neomarinimicrobiota bacterium]|nr:MAG: hypothetical protein CM1200mP10_06820 [Candidatus Neomarinimicrobiota bacterium]